MRQDGDIHVDGNFVYKRIGIWDQDALPRAPSFLLRIKLIGIRESKTREKIREEGERLEKIREEGERSEKIREKGH